MASESYTLKEVAELLGVSKRTLQRRIREGAFPHRFLAPGPHGLETRIPATDLEELEPDAPDAALPSPVTRTLVPQQPLALAPATLSAADLEAVRETVLVLARQERESVLALVQQSLDAHAREAEALRAQLASVQGAVERLRRRLEAWMEAKPGTSFAHDAGGREALTSGADYGAALLGEIEALLSRLPRH